MPARRLAATAAVAAATVVLGTVPGAALAAADDGAQAGRTSAKGTADAVVLRAGLDVSLLNGAAKVPLNVSLNEVRAPRSAEKTALTAQLDAVDQGRPFSVLRADVATARATVNRHRSEGYANLAHATVHVPGLPLLSLVEVEQVTSKVVCAAGARPTAESNVLGSILVLGKKVTLSAGGTTEVAVPGVGTVQLGLSRTTHTSQTAAATALDLKVSVNPGNLNVAAVDGQVTLAQAHCQTPGGATPGGGSHDDTGNSGPGDQGGDGDGTGAPADSGGDNGADGDTSIGVQSGANAEDTENLAETGGSSTTPYLAGSAVALIALGGAALLRSRRRTAAHRQH